MTVKKITIDEYDRDGESCIYRSFQGEVWLNKHKIRLDAPGLGIHNGICFFEVDSNADVVEILRKSPIDLDVGADFDMISEVCDV